MQAPRRAFTLVEMVVALGVFSLLLLAGQSAVMVVSRTAARSARAGCVAERCAVAQESLYADVHAATALTVASGSRFVITVPDCTGDGAADTVEYSWSGTAGSPLLRSVNGAAGTEAITNVQTLVFSYAQQAVTMPGTAVESIEVMLAANSAPASTGSVSIANNKSYAMLFTPRLPADAVSWSITRVRLMLASQGSAVGRTDFKIQQVSSGRPGAVINSQPIMETYLGTTLGWKNIAFLNISGRAPGETLALVATWVSDSNSCQMQLQTSGTLRRSDELLFSSDQGVSWATDSQQDLVYEVYGKYTTPGTTTSIQAYRSISAQITTGAPDSVNIAQTVPLANLPGAG